MSKEREAKVAKLNWEDFNAGMLARRKKKGLWKELEERIVRILSFLEEHPKGPEKFLKSKGFNSIETKELIRLSKANAEFLRDFLVKFEKDLQI
jgi:hypothetical protein